MWTGTGADPSSDPPQFLLFSQAVTHEDVVFLVSGDPMFLGGIDPKGKRSIRMARLPAHSVLAFVYLRRQDRDVITALYDDLSFGDTGQIWKPFCKHTQAPVKACF